MVSAPGIFYIVLLYMVFVKTNTIALNIIRELDDRCYSGRAFVLASSVWSRARATLYTTLEKHEAATPVLGPYKTMRYLIARTKKRPIQALRGSCVHWKQ